MDYETHIAPATPIPWLHISEPTGFIGELHLICYYCPTISLFSRKLFRVLASKLEENCLRHRLPTETSHSLSGDLKKQNNIEPQTLLCARIQSQYFPGHGVSVLAEGTLPILHTGHSLQAAPGSGPSSVQIFGYLENMAFFSISIILNIMQGLRQFGGPSGWLLHWTG